jgi:hypothetical protein
MPAQAAAHTRAYVARIAALAAKRFVKQYVRLKTARREDVAQLTLKLQAFFCGLGHAGLLSEHAAQGLRKHMAYKALELGRARQFQARAFRFRAPDSLEFLLTRGQRGARAPQCLGRNRQG